MDARARTPLQNQIIERGKKIWSDVQALPPNQRMFLAGAMAFGLVGLLLAGSRFLAPQPTVAAFSGLSGQDSAAITQVLSQAKIPYQLSPDGSTINVPSADAGQARVDAASQGLPHGNNVGWSIFDQAQPTSSSFQNQVEYLQALEGEINNTLDGLSEVQSARVEIVLPQQSLFLDQSTAATAAVFLQLRPYATLTSGEVRGIVYMVSHSVQGLSPKNITVVNSDGNILNQNISSGTSNSLTGTMGTTQAFDQALQSRLNGLLQPVMGIGNVVTQVSATLNFNSQTVDTHTYTPATKAGLLTSQHQVTSSSTGQNAPTAAGTSSNIPSYVGTGGTSSSKSSDITQNFALDQTVTHTVIPAGAVNNLAVAVVINKALSSQQKAAILQTVQAAIGYDPARHDRISVVGLPFNHSFETAVASQVAAQNSYNMFHLLMVAGIAIAALAVLFILGRMLLSRRQPFLPDLAAMDKQGRSAPFSPGASPAQEGGSGDLGGLIQQQPEAVTEILRAWLQEEGGRG